MRFRRTMAAAVALAALLSATVATAEPVPSQGGNSNSVDGERNPARRRATPPPPDPAPIDRAETAGLRASLAATAADDQMGWALKSLQDDPEGTLRWATQASKNQDPRGDYLLGLAYREGLGIAKSQRAALSFFRQAADTYKFDPAFIQAARIYISQGTRGDLDQAYRYLQKGSTMAKSSAWRSRYTEYIAAYDKAEAQMKSEQAAVRRERERIEAMSGPGSVFMALFAAAWIYGNRPGASNSYYVGGTSTEDYKKEAEERERTMFQIELLQMK